MAILLHDNQPLGWERISLPARTDNPWQSTNQSAFIKEAIGHAVFLRSINLTGNISVCIRDEGEKNSKYPVNEVATSLVRALKPEFSGQIHGLAIVVRGPVGSENVPTPGGQNMELTPSQEKRIIRLLPGQQKKRSRWWRR